MNSVRTNDTPLVNVPQLRFGKVQLATGVQMHYAEYGNPDGKPILFLHGFTDSWFSFSPVLEYLSTEFHVYMPDQRGHGDSSEPDDGYAVADFAKDAIAFMNEIGLQRVTLIGHSLGSFTAQRVAFASPDRIERLVLIGSASNPHTDDMDVLMSEINMLQDPVPEAFIREFQTSTLYSAVPAHFLNSVIYESKKLSAKVWRLAISEMIAWGMTPQLEHIHAPTAIFWGEYDTIFAQAEQETLAKRIPDAELYIYPETGHGLHWEKPEQFAHDLEAIMKRT